jgi:hypothetical protein
VVLERHDLGELTALHSLEQQRERLGADQALKCVPTIAA